jgi:hypothetical protein
MKRIAIPAITFGALFLGLTLMSNLPVSGHDNDQDRNGRDHEDERELEIQQGLSIAPVPLTQRHSFGNARYMQRRRTITLPGHDFPHQTNTSPWFDVL